MKIKKLETDSRRRTFFFFLEISTLSVRSVKFIRVAVIFANCCFLANLCRRKKGLRNTELSEDLFFGPHFDFNVKFKRITWISQTIQVKTFFYWPSISFITRLRPAAKFQAKISLMRPT